MRRDSAGTVSTLNESDTCDWKTYSVTIKLEHVGIVVGETFDEFIAKHKAALTGQQDQGPYCQPVYITFDNNMTVKFYRWSLKDVVEKEGREFVPYPGA